MNIAIYGKVIEAEHRLGFQQLIDYLHKKQIHFRIYNKLRESISSIGIEGIENHSYFSSREELSNEIDFLLSIGGDGTFLDSVQMIRALKIPILGINTGRLGFLSNTPTSEMEEAIDCLLEDNFSLEKRALLTLESESALFGEDHYALNEISIMKRDSSSMIIIHTELDGKHLNSYWTDGLIISTSTGSTAYSLSCGGPILMPGGGNFVVTPIAPHNLNVRPIVIDDKSVLSISVEGRAEKNLVALDSRSRELDNHELLTIKKANHQINLVQLPNQSFLKSLRNKLNWGLDKRNK
jgi:NAD+ kinase